MRLRHLPGARQLARLAPLTALLLVAGYAVALLVLAQVRRVFAERRTRWFVALEVAMAAITLGWGLRGQTIGVIINGVALVGLAVGWRLRKRG